MASSDVHADMSGTKRPVQDPQGPVLELLHSFGAKRAQGLYNRQIRGKTLRFEVSLGWDASVGAERRRQPKQRGGGKRHKEAQAKSQWDELRYEEFGPLREMWKAYIEGLQLGEGLKLAAGLASADLHGSTLRVVQAKNPGCVNLCGTVIEETQKAFRIIAPDSRVRVLLKERCIFELEARGERIRLLGPAWVHRLPNGVPGPSAPSSWKLP
eukprot:CAMPEP_0171085248 /NCGR_PEP_ID=MMETSP0766_2-20121228/18822_1 /TAXON_ID=439317 /ORGANISM="Gambierdiscus australes, Strain CAWD 149" /LENGTH=211 /DNA_ID=CAMNT_0011542807 /DNA_START=35 /DNA_END=666 /DNA_ORIENTATION=-